MGKKDFDSKKQEIAKYIEEIKNTIEKQVKKIEEYKETERLYLIENAENRLRTKQENLGRLQGIYEYMRPNNQNDVKNRAEITKGYSSIVKDVIPNDVPVVFHGTKYINVVLQIIKSGGLLTPAQRGVNDSSFASGIDVTSKNNIQTSCDFAEPGIDSYLPYGAIFVFKPLNEEEEEVLKTKGTQVGSGIKGVNFTEEPDRLISIITTDENKQRIEDWCLEYGWPTGKVTTHEEFIEKCKEMYEKYRDAFYLSKVRKNELNKYSKSVYGDLYSTTDMVKKHQTIDLIKESIKTGDKKDLNDHEDPDDPEGH